MAPAILKAIIRRRLRRRRIEWDIARLIDIGDFDKASRLIDRLDVEDAPLEDLEPSLGSQRAPYLVDAEADATEGEGNTLYG